MYLNLFCLNYCVIAINFIVLNYSASGMPSRGRSRRHGEQRTEPETVRARFKEEMKTIDDVAARLDSSAELNDAIYEISEAERNGLPRVFVRSGVHVWAKNRHDMVLKPPNRVPICPASMQGKVPLAKGVGKIAHEVFGADVVLVEAPTGSGKSVVIPTVMDHVARYIASKEINPFPAWKPGSGWKVIHLTPTGEQAIQNSNWVRDQHELRQDDIKFGVYTSAVDEKQAVERKDAKEDVNYLYATTFFGAHAMGGVLHAVVVDEVHEWNPDLIKFLRHIRHEISDSPDTRRIFKLIMLSATLSDATRTMLVEYFQDRNLTVATMNMGKTPYVTRTVLTSDEQDNVMRSAMGNKDQRQLYEEEVDDSGMPRMNVLVKRSVAIQEQAIIQMRSRMDEFGNLPNPPGIMAFAPGRSDVNKTRSWLLKTDGWLTAHRDRQMILNLYKVSGGDRADVEFLKIPYRRGNEMRIIHSTPLLSSGVTVSGVYFVIDDGTLKIPGPYNRSGAFHLELRFEDKNMADQKRGRISRIAPGDYYNVVSKERFNVIQQSDWTVDRLNRSFRTNDMPACVEYYREMMILPDEETHEELMIEMSITGFAHENEVKVEDVDVRWKKWTPTIYAKILGNAFSGTTLAQADFLIRCASMGIGLHGAIFIASCSIEHRAIRRATGDVRGGGRDAMGMAMNRWSRMTGASFDSDMEQITEICLNLLFNDPACRFIKDRLSPVIIEHVDDIVDKDNLRNLFRRVTILNNCLEAVYFEDDCFAKQLEDCYSVVRSTTDGRVQIYRLNHRQRSYFNACILSSFGNRVLYRASKQHEAGKRTIYTLGGTQPARVEKIRDVQGERAVSSKKLLAVYDMVMNRSSEENFMTGMLHYTSVIDFALFGNANGAERDEVDEKTGTLKIPTNTADVYISFKELKTLRSVVKIRKVMRLLGLSALVSDEAYDAVRKNVMKMTYDLKMSRDVSDSNLSWKLEPFNTQMLNLPMMDGDGRLAVLHSSDSGTNSACEERRIGEASTSASHSTTEGVVSSMRTASMNESPGPSTSGMQSENATFSGMMERTFSAEHLTGSNGMGTGEEQEDEEKKGGTKRTASDNGGHGERIDSSGVKSKKEDSHSHE